MKHFIRVLFPAVLVVTTVLSSGCTSGQSATLTKIVKIVATDFPCVAEALYDGGTVFDRNAGGVERAFAAFSILKECVPDGIQTYNIVVARDPSTSLPANFLPYVDIEYELDATGSHIEHTYPTENSLQLTTNAVSNCSSAPASAGISVTVPFELFLQSDGDTAPLSYDQTRLDGLGLLGASDVDLIAERLYSDTKTAHFPIIFLGKLLAFQPQTIPGKTTESFTVAYTASYLKGGALVSRQGNPGKVYAWLYVDSLTITSSAPHQVHPVTAAECP